MNIITAKDLNEKLKNKEVFLIDVRQIAEHNLEHIPNSCLIPKDTIDSHDLPITDLPFVLYCTSGKRSEMARQKLASQNPSIQAYSLDGGIESWKKANFSTIKKMRGLPLERQTLLTIGLLVTSGIALGVFINPLFLGLPFVIGLGTISAGITGWCGLAKLLSIMPWNR